MSRWALWRQDARALVLHAEFRLGAQEMASVSVGLLAWGLMTGVAMVKSGMSGVEAVAMSVLVFAGSSQLAAIPLIAAGAPWVVILATALCVNLRFVVFSAHLRPYLMHLPLGRRLFAGYVTADLSYVMFTRRFPQPAGNAAERAAQVAYLMGGCCFNWLSWQVSSLVGIALAHRIPAHWGLGFAGILALVGVACSLASSRLRVVSALVAGAAAVAAYALPLRLYIVVAIGASVLVCVLAERMLPGLSRPGAQEAS
jgi:predicted branched-subunit amino acid permease